MRRETRKLVEALIEFGAVAVAGGSVEDAEPARKRLSPLLLRADGDRELRGEMLSLLQGCHVVTRMAHDMAGESLASEEIIHELNVEARRP